MDNISNADSCIGQVTTFKKEEFEEEIIDYRQIVEDIKILTAETNFILNKAKQKLEWSYKLKPTKETYDKLIYINEILKN